MKLLKKILSFDNPPLVNVLILTVLSMIVLLVVGFPLVIVAIKINPNIFEESRLAVLGENPSKLAELAYSFRVYIEYFWLGDFLEFRRRQKQFNFKFNSPSSIPFLKYAIVSAFIYFALLFVQ